MKARYDFPAGGLSWPQLRDGVRVALGNIECRSVPLVGEARAHWTVHIRGSQLHYGFRFNHDGSLEVDGSSLEQLSVLVLALGGQQVPYAVMAERGADAFEFVACAAWEPEGCVFYVEGQRATTRLLVERGLFSTPEFGALGALLGRLFPTLLTEQDAASEGSHPVIAAEILACLTSDVNAELAGGNLVRLEARACQRSLCRWLARREKAADCLRVDYQEG